MICQKYFLREINSGNILTIQMVVDLNFSDFVQFPRFEIYQIPNPQLFKVKLVDFLPPYFSKLISRKILTDKFFLFFHTEDEDPYNSKFSFFFFSASPSKYV